jgi:hypothetical protein
MDLRQFATRSLAAAVGAVLHRHYSYAGALPSADRVPGSVPDSFIQKARFPEGYARSEVERPEKSMVSLKTLCVPRLRSQPVEDEKVR